MTLRRLRAIRWGFVFALLAFWLAPIANDAVWARAFADPLAGAVICGNHGGESGGAQDPAVPAGSHDCCQFCAFAASAAAPPTPFFTFTAADRVAEGATWTVQVQKSAFARWPGDGDPRGPPSGARS